MTTAKFEALPSEKPDTHGTPARQVWQRPFLKHLKSSEAKTGNFSNIDSNDGFS